MKVLFLDIDGVLNTWPFLNATIGQRAQTYTHDNAYLMIDPERVALLREIVERTGCRIVVSSSWRRPFSLADLRGFLAKRGYEKAPLVDKTPYARCRGEDIAAWLNMHYRGGLGVESYVILDDDTTRMEQFGKRFLQTDNESGLTREHVERAVALLSEVA